MRRKGPRDVDAPPAALALLPPWARPDVAERRASEHFQCAEELPDALALHSSLEEPCLIILRLPGLTLLLRVARMEGLLDL
jgi:hypothetical protein